MRATTDFEGHPITHIVFHNVKPNECPPGTRIVHFTINGFVSVGGQLHVVFKSTDVSAEELEKYLYANFLVPAIEAHKENCGFRPDERVVLIMDGARPALNAIDQLRPEFNRIQCQVGVGAASTTSEFQLLDKSSCFKGMKAHIKKMQREAKVDEAQAKALEHEMRGGSFIVLPREKVAPQPASKTERLFRELCKALGISASWVPRAAKLMSSYETAVCQCFTMTAIKAAGEKSGLHPLSFEKHIRCLRKHCKEWSQEREDAIRVSRQPFAHSPVRRLAFVRLGQDPARPLALIVRPTHCPRAHTFACRPPCPSSSRSSGALAA